MNLSMMNSARRRTILRDHGLDHPLTEEELVERLVDTELRLSRHRRFVAEIEVNRSRDIRIA